MVLRFKRCQLTTASTGAYKKQTALTVNAVDPSALSTVKLSGSGLDNGGQKITNVAAGVNDTDAVNKGQLTQAISDATASVNGKHDSHHRRRHRS